MTAEPAFHALSDRALHDQLAFWRANAGLDTGARAFLRACEREARERGLDPDTPPPPAPAEAVRAALGALLDRAQSTMIGSDRLHITLTRAELYDHQALVWPVGEQTPPVIPAKAGTQETPQ